MTDPVHIVSESEFKIATAALHDHAANQRSHPSFRLGAEPIFLVHPPGTKVHGSVLLLHGFTREASASKQQADYFFSRHFNAVSLNLAGHHLSPDHWPSVTLRESAGYESVRKALLADAKFAALIESLNNIDIFGTKEELHAMNAETGGLMSAVSALLKESLRTEEYAHAQKAFSLLDPKTPKQSMNEFHKYFSTDLHRYESDPFAKIALISALPGPIYVIGFSMGTVEAINLCAHSNMVSKAVLLAPFVGDPRIWPKSDISHFVNMAGCLDLFSSKVPQPTGESIHLPGPAYCAATIAGAFLNRDVISDAMRSSTESFCVLGEDDSVVDVAQSVEYCENKLGSRTFLYPAELGIGHGLSPEVGNRFGMSLIEEIGQYFVTDEVDERNLLRENQAGQSCVVDGIP